MATLYVPALFEAMAWGIMKFHPFRAWRSGSPSPLSTAYLHPTLKTWKMTLYDPHVIICAGLFLQHFVAQIYRFKRALLTTCPNPSWALRLARFSGHLQYGAQYGACGQHVNGRKVRSCLLITSRKASVLQISCMQYRSVAPCGENSRLILEAFGTMWLLLIIYIS